MKEKMKRQLSVLAMALVAVAASAYDFKVGELYYNIVGESAEVTHPVNPATGELVSYELESPAVSVPATVTHEGKTYDVKAVGKEAFRRCETISTISLPDGLTTIGSFAFDNSTITAISFPASLTEIGSYAFQYCLKLTGPVVVPDNVKRVGSGAFAGCIKLKNATLGSGVESVGANLFGGGFWGTKPNYLGGLEKLWYYTKLNSLTCKSVVPPKADGWIVAQDAMTGEIYKASLHVPVTSVNLYKHAPGWDIFTDVTGDVALPDASGTKIVRDNKVDYLLYMETKTAAVLSGSQGIASVTVPATVADGGVDYTVTAVGHGAFANFDMLTSVSLPETVTEIGHRAFAECTRLVSVNLPAALTSVGYEAFLSCGVLEAVTIPRSVAVIGDRAFEGCAGITTVNLPDAGVKVGRRAFAECPNLTAAHLDNCSEIGAEAFYKCPLLADAKLGAGLTAIPEGLFYDDKALASIEIPSGVTEIGADAFGGTGLTAVNLPAGLAGLARGVFRATKLTEIVIPESVGEIGDVAFFYCTNLENVAIPASVSHIGESAFAQCSGLKSVEVRGAVESIGKSAFEDCTSLASLSVSDLNAWACTEFANEVSNPMFWTKNLKSDGETVTQLNLDLGDKAVSTFAFRYCETLKTVRVKAAAVKWMAFAGCKNITDVCLDVDRIEEEAFDAWPMNVYVNRTVPPAADAASFNEYEYSAGYLYVPAGTKEAYKAVTWSWGKFLDISEKDFTGLDEIFGESGFEDVEAVTPQGEAVYYDLRGVRVNADSLAPGIYIKRQGAKSTKVVVR